MQVVKSLGMKNLFNLKVGDTFTKFEQDWQITRKTAEQIFCSAIYNKSNKKIFLLSQNLIVEQIIYKQL